jgi:DNA-binding XRE family transcriptional regulator
MNTDLDLLMTTATPEALRDARQQLGLSQQALGDRLGLCRQHVNDMERGRQAIERRTWLSVLYLLTVSASNGANPSSGVGSDYIMRVENMLFHVYNKGPRTTDKHCSLTTPPIQTPAGEYVPIRAACAEEAEAIALGAISDWDATNIVAVQQGDDD